MSADNANNAIAIAVHTEQCCARLTTSMDRMLDGLQAQMEEITNITREHVVVYEQAMDEWLRSIEGGVEEATELVEGAVRLHESMADVGKLWDRVKNMKRIVDALESQLE